MTQRPLPRLTKGASSVSPTGARAASPPRAAVSRHGEATPGARAPRHGDGGLGSRTLGASTCIATSTGRPRLRRSPAACVASSPETMGAK